MSLAVIISKEPASDAEDDTDGSLTVGAKQKLGMHIRTLAQIHDFLTEQAKTSEDLTYVSAHKTLAMLVPMVQATVANLQ